MKMNLLWKFKFCYNFQMVGFLGSEYMEWLQWTGQKFPQMRYGKIAGLPCYYIGPKHILSLLVIMPQLL